MQRRNKICILISLPHIPPLRQNFSWIRQTFFFFLKKKTVPLDRFPFFLFPSRVLLYLSDVFHNFTSSQFRYFRELLHSWTTDQSKVNYLLLLIIPPSNFKSNSSPFPQSSFKCFLGTFPIFSPTFSFLLLKFNYDRINILTLSLVLLLLLLGCCFS